MVESAGLALVGWGAGTRPGHVSLALSGAEACQQDP
jgi:hypothetical protein